MNKYNSSKDTKAHIRRVRQLLGDVINDLEVRGMLHDKSKLNSPEKEIYDKYTPILRELVYGSEEYNKNLENLKVALDHHYANNSHHPQFYQNGIDGMNLMDLIEMYVDWKAAGERTKGGNMADSIRINSGRFKMSEQLTQIFKNTLNYWEHETN